MNNELKRIKKLIERHYWKNGQRLLLDTRQVMEHNKEDCHFDVKVADSDIFLFEVANYNAYRDLDLYLPREFNKDIIAETWNGVHAACDPLYFKRVFHLKTFASITEEDIVNCGKYFIRQILEDTWQIWNIDFKKEENTDV